VARIICLCGAITVAPIIYSMTNDGEVDSSPKASVALSTATSGGNITMYFGDPITHQQREGLGHGFISILSALPGEHEPRPLLWTTDDGFDRVLSNPPSPRST
jgi:hypothetical protein